MRVQLIAADSLLPNHALMVLSAWHKSIGDEVKYFEGTPPAWGDIQYRSVLFRWGKGGMGAWGITGGPGFDPGVALPTGVDWLMPDYSIYPDNRASWGYTYRGCPRKCEFCYVSRMPMGEDKEHHSITEFINPEFGEIALLNNNTWFDERWRDTFDEINGRGLKVWDLNGYDHRLLDREKVGYIKKTRWKKGIHFAFDRDEDRDTVIRACEILNGEGIARMVEWYVMVGWKYTREQDMERINLLKRMGHRAVPLLYNKNDNWGKSLKRWALNRSVYWATDFRDYKDQREVRRGRIPEGERERADMLEGLGPKLGRRILK